jgi:hypothetical protein
MVSKSPLAVKGILCPILNRKLTLAQGLKLCYNTVVYGLFMPFLIEKMV